MKSKIVTLMFVGLVSSSLIFAQSGRAQDNAAGSEATTNAVAAGSPAAEASADSVSSQAGTNQPAAPEAQPSGQESPAATTTPATTTIAEAPVEKQEEVIPLIQFQDVQLTTAIENLARQAGINYILDPKVGFGQLDERGQPRSQPNISLRWENVTASQALAALLQNHGLQLIQDSKTKIARITVKDPALPDPLMSKVVQLKFASPSNLVAAVQATFTDKRSKIFGDVRTSQLVVLATEKEHDAIEKLVARLDLQTKQVLIEAKLLETSQNPKTMKGIDWTGTMQAQHFTFGNNAVPGVPPSVTPILDPGGSGAVIGSSTDPGTIGGILSGAPRLLANTANGFFPKTAFLNADGVDAVLSFLNSSGDARVIATPRAVTLDNEMAHLSVTRAWPIFKNTAGTQGSPGGSEVTYTNLGVILNVTPRISANNFINLKIIPEVSRIFDVDTKTVSGQISQANIYDIRRMDTAVMIPSGDTLVLGGLVSDDVRSGNRKVPLLGDLPVIGLAFRHDSKERQQNNLMIFITPTVVQDSDFQQLKPTDFLKTPPAEIDTKEWSAWDSGKPYDWSKIGR